jgi:hypothetical protein
VVVEAFQDIPLGRMVRVNDHVGSVFLAFHDDSPLPSGVAARAIRAGERVRWNPNGDTADIAVASRKVAGREGS